MPAFQHQELAAGRWFELSLFEQLGNVGSEVHRMARSRESDPERFQNAFVRALELLDLTLRDPRWRMRLKEIARAREALCDAATGGSEYGSTLEDMDRYFFHYALAARRGR